MKISDSCKFTSHLLTVRDDVRQCFAIRRMILQCLFKMVVVMAVLSGTMAVVDAQLIPAPLIAQKTAGVTTITTGPDKSAFRIDATVGRVDTQSFAIKGNRRYELTLQARVDSTFVIEDNDRAEILTLQSFRFRKTSTYQLVFLNQKNEEISSVGYGGTGFLLTRTWYPYILAFDTPVDAVAVKIRIEPAKRVTYLRDAQLKQLPDDGTLILNPDFRYGPLNYSGWQTSRDGRLITRPDGSVIFHPGYGGTSGIFPLEPQASYRVTAKGVGGKISLIYYDQQGKRVTTRFLIDPTAKGDKPVEFMPADGARFGRLVMYGVDALEACQIVKLSGMTQ